MADTFTSAERSRIMAAVKSRDTTPELIVRRVLHGLGYRYRLNVHTLPGCPDLVFPSRRKIILVHGCFWHGHRCRRGRRLPKTRASYWRAKITGNVARDRRNVRTLKRLGWQTCVVWECHTTTKKISALTTRLTHFLA